MNFEKMNQTPNSSLPLQGEVIDVTPINVEETKAIVLAKASENRTEILALTDKLDLTDTRTLVTFGKEAADEISKCSDTILNSVEMDKIEGAGQLMKSLTVIMDKFDVKELSEEKNGFLSKIFGNAKTQLDKILNKYNTMGGEVEKIYIELKRYEQEIAESNNRLEDLYNTNMEYYKLLAKYILAGEEGCRQIDEYRKGVQAQYDQTGDHALSMQLQNLDMGKQMLEQRVQDLRIAENVALQTIPMLKAMEYSNLNLSRKINSAFIITLPVFKQSLAQAVLLKRQKVQADAMAALDAKTNEMLLKNAQNTVEQTKLTTQLASGSSVKMETLEQTWRTIMQGIEDTQKIQEQASQQRIVDAQKSQALKGEFNQKLLNA